MLIKKRLLLNLQIQPFVTLVIDRSAIFFKNLCIGWYLKLIGLQQSWRGSYLRFPLHYNGRQFLDTLSNALAISLKMRLHRFLCSLDESFEGFEVAISLIVVLKFQEIFKLSLEQAT